MATVLFWGQLSGEHRIRTSGNLRSRFSDFLTSDGEKPWRDRESEFEEREVTRSEAIAKWEEGWEVLFNALESLHDDDLSRTVTIRGVPLTVHEALHRSLAHTSYHVGQMVYAGRWLRGSEWKWLSIPPGQSEQYNRSGELEKPADHADAIAHETEREPDAR